MSRSGRPVTLACGAYDRIEALASGEVRAEGLELNFIDLEPEEIFFRMAHFGEFDVAEMSLSSYCMLVGRGLRDLVAIPVFPSRVFRHSAVYVSSASGITEPAQLAGRRVGLPEYQITAVVWIRGILADEHGLAVDSVEYVQGGQEQAGRTEKLAIELPASIKVSTAGEGRTLSRMLADGEIDALYSARAPSTLTSRPGTVRRLFADHEAVERRYWRSTGIFPIMHLIVLSRELYEEAPFAAASLCKAFEESKRRAYERLQLTGVLQTMLPWQMAEVERLTADGGADWWPYGLEANRVTLETFLRYHHGQGLSPRLLRAEELFAPSTLESAKI